MSTLFMFPGQGSQSPGMLSRLPDTQETAQTLAESTEVLGQEPQGLETPEALRSTVAVQLCLLIAGVAMARNLIARGVQPRMVTGMSIGAFPAAVVAGILDYRDALRLVSIRAQAMEQAFPSGHGMTAVIGLDIRRLDSLVHSVNAEELPVFIANINAERQLIVSGCDAGMERVTELAMQQGASRCERLDVAVPSHCPLLEPVAVTMRAAMRETPLSRPRIAYLSCSAARTLADPERIREDLASNVARQVNWPDTIRLAWELGTRLAVEMPARDVLCRLSQESFQDGGIVIASEGRSPDSIATLADAQARRMS
ncbi:MAG: malonate decarboxylase subunit epsilon [Lautropia sp.]|nr:malonate decarboxylase subunit epsilon [Lautropia sp.]